MVQGYIYRHWIVNDKGVEKSYIGLTTDEPKIRWRKDGKGYTRNGQDTKFANAIKKYGWENFSHEIIGIVESDTKEQLIRDLGEWEKYYIEKYDSFHNGYNTTTGGENFYAKSDEYRKKMSETMKEIYKDKTKHPFYGKHHGEETKRKLSEASRKQTRRKATKVKCVTTGEIFDSIKEANEKYNISKGKISDCCRGNRKSTGKHPETGEKLIWKYYE